jgi:hypothetical protein
MVAECMEIDDYLQNIVTKLDSKDVLQVLKTIIEVNLKKTKKKTHLKKFKF